MIHLLLENKEICFWNAESYSKKFKKLNNDRYNFF